MKGKYIPALLSLCLALQPLTGSSAAPRHPQNSAEAARPLLPGIWEYTGSAIRKGMQESEATVRMCKELDRHLDELGFRPDVTCFVFRENGTFTLRTGERTLTGTYTYHPEKEHLTLRYFDCVPLRARIQPGHRCVRLLFDPGGFLSLLTFAGNPAGSAPLHTVAALSDGYDDMLIGIELQKR